MLIYNPCHNWRATNRLAIPVVVLAVLAVGAAGRAATFHVSVQGNDAAPGTLAAPWRTLRHAVDSVKPGDSILVGPGTYRERIELARGGAADAPLVIAAVPGARVVVTGADLLSDGWAKVDSEEGVYSHEWAHRFPINGPDDLTHPADPQHELTGRAEQVIHDGRLLRQVLRREQLARDTFFVDLAAKKLFIKLRDNRDPATCDLEAATRTQWLAGGPDVSHVQIRGITFRYAANHAQRGALMIGGQSRGWVVEDCVLERANGPGASLGGRGHVVRRCAFQDNGQLGFGAHACHETRLEQCDVYRNNVKGYSTDWEGGGLKVVLSRGFAMHRCRVIDNRGPGIWYDIGNEQAEVAHCLVADNDEAGIFYEISYGLHAHDNLVVNNANLGSRPRRAWGFGGITLSSSEDCVVEHNTLVSNRDGITLREQNRTTPRIDGGERRVLNRNHAIRNNLVASSQGYNVGLWLDTTFFGPHAKGHDKHEPITEDPRTLKIAFENNFLFALAGQPNYLYGCPWRPKSKTANTAADFTVVSGIADSSREGNPLFIDLPARDFRLLPNSPAARLKTGVRDLVKVPQR